MTPHTTTIICEAPGYYVECSCGWRNGSYYARSPAEEAARDHVEQAALRLQGKDRETLRAHGVETGEGILFGGALFDRALGEGRN
jgi:hypothetical protein